MEFCFEALRGERLGEQAELVIERAPLQARCGSCTGTWELVEPLWACPGCGASELTFENSGELDLVAIEVDDATDDSHRGEASR